VFFDGLDDHASVPASASLNLTGSFTVEGWINPVVVSAPQPILEWANGTNQLGVQLWLAHPLSAGSGALFADVVDTTARSHHLSTPINRVAAGVWSHIAMTYNRTNGVGRLYVNGVQYFIAAVGMITPETRFGMDFGHHAAASPVSWFKGGLDEISIYLVALDTAQIQAIHAAGAGGKCLPGALPTIIVQPLDDIQPLFGTAVFSVVASGPGPLSYQWQHDGMPIADATNATLVLSNLVPGQSGLYAATVANPFGTALSSNASLTVLSESAPLVLPNPFTMANGESATMTFSSRARVQQVYSSSHFARGPSFGGPILIRALRWRPSAPVGHAFTGVVARLQIHLSTTQADPEELQPNFASNTGPDEVLAFDGNIELNSAFAGQALGPKEFDIVVPLTNPFAYDPQRGHLLVDVRNFSETAASPLDAAIRTNDTASRVFAANPLAAQGTGHDVSADIIAVDYSLISAPPTIHRSPQGHFIAPGETTTLRVVAGGTAPLSYQWHLDGTPVPGATNAALRLVGFEAVQSGTYTVEVANYLGAATSSPARLVLLPDAARVVVPNFATNQPGGTAASTLRASARVQQIYGSNHFRAGTIAIREIRFRPDPATMVGTMTAIGDAQINLSTTIIPAESPTSVFTNNAGLDDVTVFRGRIPVLSGFGPRSDGVQPFDIVIPLDTPYVYEPAVGNLVVDLRNFTGSQAPLVDTSLRVNDSAGRAFATDLQTPLPTTIDGGADVVELVYTPTSAPPTVLSQPRSLTRVPGESATFQTRAGGSAPFRYQWMFNGQPIPGRTNVTLPLLDVRETNAGVYSVRIENALGSMMSAGATLTILSNGATAVIPREYANQTGGTGSGSFESRIRQHQLYFATNFPPFPIKLHGLRWRPNAAEGRAFDPMVVQISIALSTVQLGPGGLSRTFAENLGMDYAEVFHGTLPLSSAFLGPASGPKQFDMFVPFQTEFLLDSTKGDLLVEFRNFPGAVTTPVDGGGAPSAAGRVWSDNPDGATATTARGDVDIMQVLYTPVFRPSILVPPAEQTVQEGSTVTLSVIATGSAPLHYQWQFDSTPLAGQTNATLVLAAARTNQSGLYSVSVSNAAGVVTSAAARVTIFHVNLPPSAQPQTVSLLEDSAAEIQLKASDPEGDPLIYHLTTPMHGSLTGTPPNVFYKPATNYFGLDQFSFRVSDGVLDSLVALVRIELIPVNDPPEARATVGPLLSLSPGQMELLILSADNSGANVVLDGSLSSDIENDPLQYAWIATDSGALLATGQRVTNTFALGTHPISLLVSDGSSTSQNSVEFEVITTGEAATEVIGQIDQSNLERRQIRPLIASLKAAIASFDRGQLNSGKNQLRAVQHKIESQVRPVNSALAEQLANAITHILSALGEDRSSTN